MATEEKVPFWIEFLAGWVGGIGQVLTAQPFDIIKIRLQTQSTTNPIYTSTADCFKKILKNEGPLTFYKGTASPLIGVGSICATQFMAYQECKKKLSDFGIKAGTNLSFFISGTFAGCASSFIVAPVEHLRIRMQIQGTKKVKLYTGSIDAGIKIFKQYGISGVAKGWVATVARDGTFFGFYFMFYEIIARLIQGSKDDKISPLAGFVAGGATGIITWVSTFPTDSLKSIAQADSLDKSKRQYTGYINMVSTVLREQGIKKLYNGLFVCALRGFPANAVTFLFYEVAKDGFMKLRRK